MVHILSKFEMIKGTHLKGQLYVVDIHPLVSPFHYHVGNLHYYEVKDNLSLRCLERVEENLVY